MGFRSKHHRSDGDALEEKYNGQKNKLLMSCSWEKIGLKKSHIIKRKFLEENVNFNSICIKHIILQP